MPRLMTHGLQGRRSWWVRGMTPLVAMFAVVVTCAAPPAFAQPAFTPDPVDPQAAKKEGRAVWYTSTPVENATRIAKMFEADTGIKIDVFRSGGSAVLRRFMQEIEAGRVLADVLTTSDPGGFGVLVKRGLLVPFKPLNWDKLPVGAKDPAGFFFAQRLNLMSIYVRTDKVAAADMPKTWDDLKAPKYKGRLVMTDPSYTSLQLSVVGTLAKVKGWGFYEAMRANDIMIVQGNQQVAENLRRGERVIAVGASDSYATDDRKDGHPIASVLPDDGAFVIPSPTAVIKGSANPNAAKLFAQFMLTDAVQSLFPQEGGYGSRIDIAPPANNPPLTDIKTIPIDYDYIEKEGSRIKKKFADVFQ